MNSDEIIGSSRCKKCGRTVRVLPGERCSCEYNSNKFDMSQLTPLTEEQREKLSGMVKKLSRNKSKKQ